MKLFSPFVPGMAIVILAFGPRVAGAQTDRSPMANIGAGSQFVVGATPIVIPANEDFVYFQDGALSSSADVDQSRPSCRLLVTRRPAVRQLPPDRKLIVTGAWIKDTADNSSDYDILVFENDKAVDQLQCNKGKGTKGNTTIGELKAALGRLFKLVPAPPRKAEGRDLAVTPKTMATL
jgi:hypothetical protein